MKKIIRSIAIIIVVAIFAFCVFNYILYMFVGIPITSTQFQAQAMSEDYYDMGKDTKLNYSLYDNKGQLLLKTENGKCIFLDERKIFSYDRYQTSMAGFPEMIYIYMMPLKSYKLEADKFLYLTIDFFPIGHVDFSAEHMDSASLSSQKIEIFGSNSSFSIGMYPLFSTSSNNKLYSISGTANEDITFKILLDGSLEITSDAPFSCNVISYNGKDSTEYSIKNETSFCVHY